VTLGRELHSWSRLDDEWQLGIWQPRFRWDYLHPMTVGLTGAFAHVDAGPVHLTGFASPIFIPERGASIDAAGGALSSASPWFISPPRVATLGGVATDVNYALAVPALREIVLHPSFALGARIGGQEGLWLGVAAARKPMNQLAYGVSGFYALEPQAIEATIHPRVLEHELVTVEGGYERAGYSAWLSFLLERPLRDDTPGDWTTQEFSVARVVSPGVSLPLGRDSSLALSYLWVSGGNAPDQSGTSGGGGLSTGTPGSQSIFEDRYPFSNALRVRGRTSMAGPWHRRLSGESSVLFGRGGQSPVSGQGQGLIWSTELRLAEEDARGFAIGVGADILAAQADSQNNDDFISQYRSNQEFHAGVSYGF
jgi:hypothetical protein